MIGILPAAGKAERFNNLPKYLLPVWNTYLLKRHCNLMRGVNPQKILIAGNQVNTDILRDYANNGETIYTVNTETMTETVLHARKYLWYSDVIFGMPDTYFDDDTTYLRLVQALDGEAMIVVAAFNCPHWQRKDVGMLDIGMDSEGHFLVENIIDKSVDGINLPRCWGAAAWKPEFWNYMEPRDPHIGYGIQRAIHHGVPVKAVLCLGSYYDLGTPYRYYRFIAETWKEQKVGD